jgi:hypothetical protein
MEQSNLQTPPVHVFRPTGTKEESLSSSTGSPLSFCTRGTVKILSHILVSGGRTAVLICTLDEELERALYFVQNRSNFALAQLRG